MIDIIKETRDFVERECKKPTSKYGYEPFPFHFIPMVRYAEQLADELGGDKEIISIAAWLHDIGSIMHWREDHHITGAKIAEEKLQELHYPQEKIDLIKKCIINHRGSKNNPRESIEEKIIAEADVMSSFDNLSGIFKAAFVYENLSQGDAKASVRNKLQNKRNQLHFEKSKEIVKPKYEAMVVLLGE
jgi:uncharacterized protein